MKEYVRTRNGNMLDVRTGSRGVRIADWRLLAGKYPMYIFGAFAERPGLLCAIVRSRAPGDWPHRKHPDIRPVEQMQQTIDYFDGIGTPITTFSADWAVDDPLYNTNALLFRNYMDNPLYQHLNKIERQKAAALHTPTGKMMTQLGFVLDTESIIDNRNGIKVDFLRGEP